MSAREAVQDLDLMDPASFRDGMPHEYLRRLRATPGLPLGHDTDGEPLWYVTRHAEVAAVSRDTERFSSSPTTMTSVRKRDQNDPIITFLDGADHVRMRRLTFKAFAPARMAALQDRVRAIVADLLDRCRRRGEFDLAEDVALRLPFEVLADLLGVPDGDRDTVLGWARQTVNLGDPEYDSPEEDLFQKLLEYFLDFAALRARRPADDFFSIVLGARLRDDRLGLPDRLTPEEAGVFATTLITAGSETTYCAVTGAVLALLEFPDQLARLRSSPELLPSAVEEVLRWVTPVTHFARRAVTDTEVAGQPIAAGERVVVWYTSANRDESVFDEPDRFDVGRSPNPHVAFGGGGPHFCIGNGLATMELREFLSAAVPLLPRMEVTGPPVRPTTNFMNSVKHLPMRFRGARDAG
ncbi:cytochrome P450 [Spirillospora sp. NPDC049652]